MYNFKLILPKILCHASECWDFDHINTKNIDKKIMQRRRLRVQGTSRIIQFISDINITDVRFCYNQLKIQR